MLYKDTTFSKEMEISLCGNEFYNCKFFGCTVVFDASGDLTLDGCHFDEPNVRFTGAAAGTIEFLREVMKRNEDGSWRDRVVEMLGIAERASH